MSFIRKITYQFTGAIFKLLLLTLPVLFGIAIVLGSPDTIQGALKESRVYDQIVDVALDNSKDTATDSDTKTLLSDPEVRNAVQKSITPQILEQSTGSVVDGIYGWLQGKTAEPIFSIDLSDAKNNLSNNLAAYAEKRASALPVCTIAQLQTVDLQGDLLSLPCRPPGTNIAQVGQQFSEQLISDIDLLDKPIITSQTIKDENNGKAIVGDANGLPRLYSAVQTGKWIVLGITVLLGLLLIFARRDRKAGLRHVGWALVGVGTFFVIALITYWFVFDQANQSRANADAIQAMWLDGGKAILRSFNEVVMWFIGAYVLIGGGLLIALKLRTNRNKSVPQPTDNPDPVQPLV